MQMKIIQCKWKLSHANENYPMQMKNYRMQMKNYPMQMKNYRMQMKNYPMQMKKIEYCNVSHAITITW